MTRLKRGPTARSGDCCAACNPRTHTAICCDGTDALAKRGNAFFCIISGALRRTLARHKPNCAPPTQYAQQLSMERGLKEDECSVVPVVPTAQPGTSLERPQAQLTVGCLCPLKKQGPPWRCPSHSAGSLPSQPTRSAPPAGCFASLPSTWTTA